MIHNGVHFAALGVVRAAETLASGFGPRAEGPREDVKWFPSPRDPHPVLKWRSEWRTSPPL
jgi:hypothetical protein